MDLQQVLITIGDVINLATPVVAALALLYFFWGLANYILGVHEDEKREKARSIMIYGILALFIMVSVWGIINVIRDTFNIDDNNIINVPAIDVDSRGQTR